MRILSAEFIKSAQKPAHYPSPAFPEIAFSGRSNVGKSTLINVLVNRRHLVKTSKTPGRTQLINFFRVNDCLSLVDLPGYGYANVPKAIRFSWGPMVETYLSSRESLKGVVLILDIRRTPGSEELDFAEWLRQQNISGIFVLTKIDKLSKNQQMKQLHIIAGRFSRSNEDFIPFSGKTRSGRTRIWTAIEALIENSAGLTELT